MLDKVAKTHGHGVVCVNANQWWQQQQPCLNHTIKNGEGGMMDFVTKKIDLNWGMLI